MGLRVWTLEDMKNKRRNGGEKWNIQIQEIDKVMANSI